LKDKQSLRFLITQELKRRVAAAAVVVFVTVVVVAVAVVVVVVVVTVVVVAAVYSYFASKKKVLKSIKTEVPRPLMAEGFCRVTFFDEKYKDGALVYFDTDEVRY